VERALGRGMAIAADLVWARGHRQIWSRDDNYPDVNSPLRPAPRPNPAFRRIMVYETAGHSLYRGLQIGLQKRHGNGFSYSVAYTWSTSDRDTEDFSFVAQDQLNPAAEWGPSSSDVRHRFSASVNVDLPLGMRMAALVNAQSALPYNITTGAANVDGFFVVRPSGVGRNSARGDDFWQTDVRLAKEIRFGRRRTELLVEAFNVLNQSNWTSFVGDMSSQRLGKPTGSTEPRQVQLGIRMDF
jgi:hypothetical protein